MVQTKVPYKLPMKASPILKTQKNPSSTIKPCPQNHDKGTKLANKMKQPQSFDSSPNYMKSTRCFEARKEKIQVPKKQISCTLLKLQSRTTATCSSTLKDGKFPPFLDLNSGGTESQGASTVKVCHYNHCSLNNHNHKPNPPLKSFLSSRRKALREHMVMKKTPLKDETGEHVSLLSDSFVDIYVNEEEDKAKGVVEKESDEMVHECEYNDLFDECSSEELEVEHSLYHTGLEIEDGDYEQSDYGSDYTFVRSSKDGDLCLVDEDGVKKDGVGISFLKEEIIAEEANEFSRDEITDCYVQFSDSESWANDVYEETQQDHGCSDEEKTKKPLTLSKKTNEAYEIEDEKIKDSPKSEDQTILTAKSDEETSIDMIESSRFTMQDSSPDSEETGNPNTKKLSPEEEETSTCKTRNTTIWNRKQGESLEALKPFNPRGPNYLELEDDDEAEKVDLRHQEMNKRRNAEEWMLDYALRNSVNRLAPFSKRKVSLLVEAFEKVTPPECI